MPTYTYECKKCGHEMDVFHSITASPRPKCEECGGSCRRLLGSGAGIIFKGSGFYETDYKEKKGTPPKKEEKAAKKSDGKGSEKASSSSGNGSGGSTTKSKGGDGK